MKNKKEGLGDLEKEIKDLEEERDFRRDELKEHSCRGNKDAYYLSEINLNKLSLKKIKIILDNCYQKLNFSMGNIFNSSISRVKGYSRLMSKTKGEQERCIDQLKYFEKKFYHTFCKSKHHIADSKI